MRVVWGCPYDSFYVCQAPSGAHALAQSQKLWRINEYGQCKLDTSKRSTRAPALRLDAASSTDTGPED
jgi:hypothetical protein